MSASLVAFLSAAVAIGVFVEAIAGFGGTVVALSIGAGWFAIDPLLGWFLPVNMTLSAYLAIRHRAHVRGRLLATRILPAMGVGLAIGTWLTTQLDASAGKAVFAALVIGLSIWELVRHARGAPGPRPMPAVAQGGILGAAGVIHGLFGTGGPLAVVVVGRMATTKHELRATLAVLWLSLNLVVVSRLTYAGTITGGSLATSALLVPALALGIVLGERVHKLVDEVQFRVLTAVLLGAMGTLLLIRSV